MVVGMLIYLFVVWALAYRYLVHNCFDDEVISLLYLGVERPREAMMLRAPETEALYEGYAQKGWVLILALDGSPMPLGSTATHEPIGISISLWGRWKSPDATGLKTLWIKKQNNPKQINISDN
jgi:hypothetical protein